MITTFDMLMDAARRAPPARVATVFPAGGGVFEAIARAARELPTEHLVYGRADVIRPALEGTAHVTIIECADADAAAARAIEDARGGRADILMKGTIDTGRLMRAVLDRERGLRAGDLLSDVFVFEYPAGRRLMMITDGGITPAPTLREKVTLIRNAVAVARSLGNELPRVALLSATEIVTPKLPSTEEAAEIAAMAARGEITGCLVAGPLALDNAVSEEAAREKRIESAVAGRADILVMPSIEAANALAKSTTYFAGFRLAHVVMGARLPLLIPSRADRSDARVLSVALGMLVGAGQKKSPAP